MKLPRVALLTVFVLLVLTGCASQLAYEPTDLPPLFVSPLAQPLTFVSPVYLPQVYMTPNKFGLAGCGSCAELGCGWCYHWSPWPGASEGIERVPMIWGASNVIVTQLGGNSVWLMGFNEPDLVAQANLTPEQAAVLWREIERKWPDRKLVAPVPSHLHPEWLVQWHLAYQLRYGQAPRIDALAMHCYLSASECIALAEQYEGLAELWGVSEGWVTEFAYTEIVPNWEQQIAQFVTYLEQSDFWKRYAPYVSRQTCDDVFWNCATAGDPSLFDGFGQLTDIGRAYQRAPQ